MTYTLNIFKCSLLWRPFFVEAPGHVPSAIGCNWQTDLGEHLYSEHCWVPGMFTIERFYCIGTCQNI